MCGVVIKSLGVPSVHDGTPKRVVCLSGIAWPAMSLVSVEEIHSMTFLMFLCSCYAEVSCSSV